MISHAIPFRACEHGRSARCNRAAPVAASRRVGGEAGALGAGVGSVLVQLHKPAGCQRSSFDSGAVSWCLSRDGFEGLYVYPSLESEAADCGGHALLDDIEKLLAPLPAGSEDWEAFASTLYGQSEVLKLDAEGRIVLTDKLRAHTGIKAEVTFVGMGRKFRMWEPSRFQVYQAEAKDRVREARRQLGFSWGGGPPVVIGSTGMTGGGGESPDSVAGGSAPHRPVLRTEVLTALGPHAGGIYVDGTFGAGGYTRSILDVPGTQVIGLDRDPSAAQAAATVAARLSRSIHLPGRSLRQPRSDRRRTRHFRSRRRRARYRRLVDAARPGRARLFIPLRRSARHADGTAWPLCSRPRQPNRRGDACGHPLSVWRGARLAPDRACHRARPGERTLHPHQTARRSRWPRRAKCAQGRASGDAHLSGAPHRGERRTRPVAVRPGGRRARAGRRAAFSPS